MTNNDEKYMRLALNLAEKGRGKVSPNPLVGAVIVKGTRVVGKGWHEKFGAAHAEINALNKAKDKARGAIMFVTLEPCSHYGKTPPCAEALIKAGLKEIIIAMKDPNPLVNGKGIQKLKKAGLKIKTGVLEKEARKLNEAYIKYITRQTPFVILKAAMTLDGKIATRTGESRWISNEESRRYVQKLRRQTDAILVGVETVLKDDPELIPHDLAQGTKPGKMPLRVIVDSRLRIPFSAKVLNAKAPTIIATTRGASLMKIHLFRHRGINLLITRNKGDKVDLRALMKNLARMNIASVLVEGGGNVNAGMLEEKMVDKILFFIAPRIIGGEKALTPVEGRGVDRISKAIKIKDVHIHRFGEDILVEGYIQ